MKKRIYLASPYGFSEQWKKNLLPDFVEVLSSLGLEVWEPFLRNSQTDMSQAGWAYQIAKADHDDVCSCDAIFAIVNGTPPDEGVMIELGIAIGLKKPVFLFRDDFRTCSDSEDYPLNLMLFCSLPKDSWKDYYYTRIDEIKDSTKALAKWAES